MTGAPLTIVLILDHASVTGGQAKVALDSALGLKRAGHRPIVFAATLPIDPRLAEAGIETHCLAQPDLVGNSSKIAAAVQGIWNPLAAKKLGALLKTLPRGQTVVHVHGWAKALSASIATPIRRSGLPAVYTMHDYFLFCPNGGFYNYPQQHSCALKPLSLPCWMSNCDQRSYADKLWRMVRTAVMRYGAALPDVFTDMILFSEFQRKIVGAYLVPQTRVHIVANPIDVEALGEKAAPASGDFLFVGRLSPEKGAAVFAETARLAKVKAVFVGDGALRASLQAMYPEAVFLGWQSPVEVRRLMRAARAVVFPSLWYEGQPLTVLESLAMGTPVVVSDACAGRQEITDGENGLWFKSQDAAALAAALRHMRDDATVTRMAHQAYRRFWADAPVLAAHVRRLEQVYAEMLGEINNVEE